MTAKAPVLSPLDPLPIEDLALDPNNPRFIENLQGIQTVPDEEVEATQKRLLQRFQTEPGGGDEHQDSSFDIKTLTDSMKQIGFVPIDRIVVRKLLGSTKYLVIEGNRRVSAAQTLLKNDQNEPNPRKKLTERVLASLRELSVLLLETDRLDQAEIDCQIGVILGLRHFGQVVEWDPLPKAVNIYKTYMASVPALGNRPELPALAEGDFAWHAKRGRSVGERLSILFPNVKNALITYIAFVQLSEDFEPGPRSTHFSLVNVLVTSAKLVGSGYLVRDAETFKLSGASLERLDRICQFEHRDTMPKEDKILREPKSGARFARLVAHAHGAREEPVRNFATMLKVEVEDGDRALDDAMAHLEDFKRDRVWAESLVELIEKQEANLAPGEYTGTANEILYREQLETTLVGFERLFGTKVGKVGAEP